MILIALLASCAGVAGWKARGLHDLRSCGYLAGDVPAYNGSITRLPHLTSAVQPTVLPRIYGCWSTNPASTMMRPLRLADARQLTSSTYLLAFGLSGVSDRSILFEVDVSGQVLHAYTYPYTL